MTGRLIVAMDESSASERALPVAVGFAERMGGHIELIGLTSDPIESARLHGRVADLGRRCGRPVDSRAVVAADEAMGELRRRLGGHPVPAVVVSDHGPRWFDRSVTDSLAGQLLAEGVPVVIVGRRTIGHAVDLPVVVCLDGSAASQQMIPVAAMWARALRVPLVVVSVTPPTLGPPQVPAALAETGSSEARQALVDVAAQASRAWPEIEVCARMVKYRWGVADALSLYLERHPAQLVVVGTHLHPGWRQAARADVTSDLLDQITVPLLMVPVQPPDAGPTTRENAQLFAVVPTSSAPAPSAFEPSPFESVIVPVDPEQGTPTDAIRTAITLARSGRSKLSFLSCHDPVVRDMDRQRLEVDDLLGPTLATWHVVRSNDVADEIVRLAGGSVTSVVCMATDAPGPVIDTLMPTITGATLRWSHRTVVLVGPRCAPTSDRFSEIVACVDGSIMSDAVVDVAAGWARAFGTRLRLLEVVDPSTTVPGALSLVSRYLGRLADLVAEHHHVGSTTSRLEAADAARALRDWADDHGDALMVMGAHGAGLSPHPLGRTVGDVVRRARIPVAVVPRPPHLTDDATT